MDQNIFISYRRADSEGYAGRIYDRLRACFGVDRVFIDVTNIGISENYFDAIDQAIGTCQVVIVLIGPGWHSITDEMGRKRLDDPHDFVRVELQAALDREIAIVPVLVQGAKMPKAEDLPYELTALTRKNTIEVHHRHFDADLDYLISEMERYLGEEASVVPEALRGKSTRWLLRWSLFLVVPVMVGVIFLAVWFGRDDNLIGGSIPPVDGTVSVSVSTVDQITPPPETPDSPTATATIELSATLKPTSTSMPTRTSTRTLMPTPTDAFLLTEIVDPFDIRMILIPQGGFIMGTDGQDPWDSIARPARAVGLDMFYLDKFEVSNAQYATCVLEGVCKAPLRKGSKTRDSYFDDARFSDYPVVYVSWQDAQTYCSWRGGRLPRESEWEKAARGDTMLGYPWGDGPIDCQRANFWPVDACHGDTLPVDSLPTGASPYGVLNMSGNVQEWVSDWLQAYPGGDPNASKEFGITHKVVRGGAYFDGPNNIRTTARKGLNPNSNHSYVGFRCVIDIKALP